MDLTHSCGRSDLGTRSKLELDPETTERAEKSRQDLDSRVVLSTPNVRAQISVKMPTGETITVDVDLSDTYDIIRQKTLDKMGILFDQQFSVPTPTGETIMLDVDLSDTNDIIRQKLQDKMGILADQQRKKSVGIPMMEALRTETNSSKGIVYPESWAVESADARTLAGDKKVLEKIKKDAIFTRISKSGSVIGRVIHRERFMFGRMAWNTRLRQHVGCEQQLERHPGHGDAEWSMTEILHQHNLANDKGDGMARLTMPELFHPAKMSGAVISSNGAQGLKKVKAKTLSQLAPKHAKLFKQLYADMIEVTHEDVSMPQKFRPAADPLAKKKDEEGAKGSKIREDPDAHTYYDGVLHFSDLEAYLRLRLGEELTSHQVLVRLVGTWQKAVVTAQYGNTYFDVKPQSDDAKRSHVHRLQIRHRAVLVVGERDREALQAQNDSFDAARTQDPDQIKTDRNFSVGDEVEVCAGGEVAEIWADIKLALGLACHVSFDDFTLMMLNHFDAKAPEVKFLMDGMTEEFYVERYHWFEGGFPDGSFDVNLFEPGGCSTGFGCGLTA